MIIESGCHTSCMGSLADGNRANLRACSSRTALHSRDRRGCSGTLNVCNICPSISKGSDSSRESATHLGPHLRCTSRLLSGSTRHQPAHAAENTRTLRQHKLAPVIVCLSACLHSRPQGRPPSTATPRGREPLSPSPTTAHNTDGPTLTRPNTQTETRCGWRESQL